MSSKFARKIRVQPTPKVCRSTEQGPRYVPIDEAHLGVALWWNGSTSIGTPLAIAQRLSMPAFVPPSSWTQTVFFFGQVKVLFKFYFSTLFQLIAAEVIITEAGNVTGNAGISAAPYGGRVPFDTGPKKLSIGIGSGIAGCRVTT